MEKMIKNFYGKINIERVYYNFKLKVEGGYNV